MKKFIAILAMMFVGLFCFAQTEDYNLPQGFSFSNEIGSDVAKITGNAHKENVDTNFRSEFGGIYDKVAIKYNSELLSFELAPKFGISDANENYYNNSLSSKYYGHGVNANFYTRTPDANGTLNSDDLAFNYWGFDWGVRFTPFELVDFYLNDDPRIVGSYLPARDNNWGASSLGSDGFAIVVKPIKGLRVSGAIPFGFNLTSIPNYMDAEVEDSWNTSVTTVNNVTDYKFHVDLGADYIVPSGLVGVGVKVNDIINAGNRWYGVYSGLNLGTLTANLGFNYSEDYVNFLDAFDDKLIYIGGKQAIAGGVTYTLNDLAIALDAMYNLKPSQSVYDLYSGAKVAYALIPGKFNIDALVAVALDLGTNTHHGTVEDDKDLTYAMKTINPNFVDLYYSHVALEDIRAVAFVDANNNVVNNDGVAASQNWQYYTALARTMSNGNLDTTSVAKAAVATRIRPGFTYTTGRNDFAAHINFVNFFDGDGSYQITFPVSWKVNF